MRIKFLQGINNIKKQPSFKAGVTNLYSDFDGTFMPYEYRHDVFCEFNLNKKDNPRPEFLKSGKEKFRVYFDSFNKFITKAKGKNGTKFNFTITSGRNRPEYNYFIKRIREDGLTVPIPDRLIIRNGGDIYTRRNDAKYFFKSDAAEVFLKTDFLQSKRDIIKNATNGWDGDKFRDIIKDTLTSVFADNNSADNFSTDYTGNNLTIFEADTDGYPYGPGMSFQSKLEMMSLKPSKYAALKENGNLEFQIFFPYQLGDKDSLETIEKKLTKNLMQDGVLIQSKIHSVKKEGNCGSISISPLIDGDKINKVFDTKIEVQRIIKGNLNDLVIAAGDDKNDIRMLDLFEYIADHKSDTEIFDAANLRKIYNLPFISIFVDNSKLKGGEPLCSSKFGIPYDQIDNYFNSDGNVRFIHVIPGNNIGKPQTLQEGIQLAIREYAKRNEKFRKKLPKDIQKLIENIKYEYPIDKSVSATLESELGVKLWNPAPPLRPFGVGKFQKVSIIALGISMLSALSIAIAKKIKNKNEKKTKNLCKIS